VIVFVILGCAAAIAAWPIVCIVSDRFERRRIEEQRWIDRATGERP